MIYIVVEQQLISLAWASGMVSNSGTAFAKLRRNKHTAGSGVSVLLNELNRRDWPNFDETALRPGEFRHIAFTIDYVAQTVALFLDGTLAHCTPFEWEFSGEQPGIDELRSRVLHPIDFGRLNSRIGQLDVDLADVRFYPKALTVADVSLLHRHSTRRDCKFDDEVSALSDDPAFRDRNLWAITNMLP